MSDQEFGVRSQIGRFGIVPLWVLRMGLSGGELAVYVALRCYADRDSKAFPSQKTIADDTGLSIQSVKRCLRSLREHDLIRSQRWHRKDGGIGGCNYVLRDIPTVPPGITDETTSGVTDDTGMVPHVRPQEHTNKNRPREQSSDASASVVADDPEPPTDESEDEDEMAEGELFEAKDVDPDAPKKIAERDRQREYNKRAQDMAKEYTRRVPLSKFPQIMTIVKRAMGSGYDDGRIRAALRQLAEDGRTVTVDSLRIAMDGLPAPKVEKPCPCCTQSPSGNANDLCAHCAEMWFRKLQCDHGASGHSDCVHV